jgi:hypothetical protein
MVSIAAGAPFGFALVVIFQGINNYLVDSYTVFAASVLAGTAVLRSVFATVFPLFTTQMYDSLGIHWASSIPAFLGLAFAPFPFLLYKYGPAIRARCKYSAEAVAFLKELQGQSQRPPEREAHHVTDAPDSTEQDADRGSEKLDKA